MATTHAFSSAQSYFLCLIRMVFHSHTSSCSQISSLLKGHFLTIPSKSLFLLLVLIKLVSSFILLVTVYNCGFILSLSLPYSDLSGTVDSKGMDTHSRCLINTWPNAWGWLSGLELNPDLQNSTCSTSATAHFYHKIYGIILPFLHKWSKSPHGLNSTNISFPCYIWEA